MDDEARTSFYIIGAIVLVFYAGVALGLLVGWGF